jgi:hypothetical protein
MPANHPIHLSLTQEQSDWLEREFQRTGNLRSKIVQDLIDAARRGKTSAIRVEDLELQTSKVTSLQREFHETVRTQLEVHSAYLKEMFRESAANLYRLEAIVEDMDDSISVRMKMNEHVRRKEREVQETIASTRAGVTRG